jgi:phosphate:Na+ symporter
MTLANIWQLVGGLGIFLFGMKTMSDGLQKSAGEGFHKLLNYMTGHPALGILTGLLTTALIQSSSATTVMLVSLVNAQLVNLTQAIGVIMGANIGTTLTSWIVSIVGFKFSITQAALPAIAIGIFFYFNKRERVKYFGFILLGFGLLFIGLDNMKDSVSVIKESGEALAFVEIFTGYGYLSLFIFIIFGTLLTIAVQSSSAAMTLTLTLAFNGIIGFEVAAAIVLGENIGTTITAYLASLEMNTTAKRAARAHMIFNLMGVLWMLVVFYPVLDVIRIVIPEGSDSSSALPFRLSAFHTLFNVTNTFLLVWFIPIIQKVVEKLVPQKEERDSDIYKISYIQSNFAENAEANLINARSEIGKMSKYVYEMMLKVMEAEEAEGEKLKDIMVEQQKTESYIDQMQEQLSGFLAECSTQSLSEYQSLEVGKYLRIINELESISDACKKITYLFKRKDKKDMEFHKKAMSELAEYTAIVMDFLKYNTDYLTNDLQSQEISIAHNMEDQINEKKRALTKRSRKQIQQGESLRGELLFMEIIRQMEHIGDFCLNISQSIADKPEKTLN